MSRSERATGPERQTQRRLAWVLSLALVAQMLLPIQSHSAWRTAPDGRVVMICTLQGIKPLRPASEPATSSDPARSPAVQFSLLLGEAAPKPETRLAPPRLIARLAPIEWRAVSMTETALPSRSIRAPPASDRPAPAV